MNITWRTNSPIIRGSSLWLVKAEACIRLLIGKLKYQMRQIRKLTLKETRICLTANREVFKDREKLVRVDKILQVQVTCQKNLEFHTWFTLVKSKKIQLMRKAVEEGVAAIRTNQRSSIPQEATKVQLTLWLEFWISRLLFKILWYRVIGILGLPILKKESALKVSKWIQIRKEKMPGFTHHL